MTVEWLKHLVTGKDGQTHDIARHSWIWTTLAVIASAAWNAVHAGVVDVMHLGTALAALVTAHGAAIGFKSGTEPDPK